MFRGNSPQYISPSRSPDRPLRGVRPATLEHKRKAPRSAGNPWSSPAGPRSRTARDRGAHRSAAAALGYPVCGVATAPPECRSPLRGRHLRRTRTMVFHRITSFAGRVSQAAGPNPPGHRAAQARRQPPRPASRRGTSVLLMVGHPAPDVNLPARTAQPPSRHATRRCRQRQGGGALDVRRCCAEQRHKGAKSVNDSHCWRLYSHS